MVTRGSNDVLGIFRFLLKTGWNDDRMDLSICMGGRQDIVYGMVYIGYVEMVF